MVRQEVVARHLAMNDSDLQEAAKLEEDYKEAYVDLINIESELREKKREIARIVASVESILDARFISAWDAAKILGDTPRNVSRQASRGVLLGAKIVGKWWVSLEDTRRKAGLI